MMSVAPSGHRGPLEPLVCPMSGGDVTRSTGLLRLLRRAVPHLLLFLLVVSGCTGTSAVGRRASSEAPSAATGRELARSAPTRIPRPLLPPSRPAIIPRPAPEGVPHPVG